MRLSNHAMRVLAARLYAVTEKTDPFAYGRAMAHFRCGVDKPFEHMEGSCKRLGIPNTIEAVHFYLAKNA